MRRIVFLEDCLSEINAYKHSEPKLVFKIFELLKDIDKTPFLGLGKPEPLKENLSGFWSRRINYEHRLIYKISDDEITVISCRAHYNQF